MSPMKLILSRGHGSMGGVDGVGISLRHRGNRDVPPMFVMKTFAFEVDLGTLFSPQKIVHSVTIDGMEINVPPKGSRPEFDSDDEDHSQTGVLIENVLITNSTLRILPQETDKEPL